MRPAHDATVEFTVNDSDKKHYGEFSDPTPTDDYHTMMIADIHDILHTRFTNTKFSLQQMADALDAAVEPTVSKRGAKQILQTLIHRGEITQCPHSEFKLPTKVLEQV